MRKRAYTIGVVSCSLVVALLGSQFVEWRARRSVAEMPQRLRTFSAAYLRQSDQPKNEGHTRKEKKRVPTLSIHHSKKAVASRRAISAPTTGGLYLAPSAYEGLETEEQPVRCCFTLNRLSRKRDPPFSPLFA